MPCSRTPQWMLRPVPSAVKYPPSLSTVPVLPARSAEPPTSDGHRFHQRAQRPAATPRRVAMPAPAGKSGNAASQPSGSFPESRSLNRANRRGIRPWPRAAFHAVCSSARYAPPPRMCSSAASGTKKGVSGQPSAALVAATLGLAQRGAVRLGGVALGGSRVGDDGGEHDQGGPVRSPPRPSERPIDGLEIVAVAHMQHMPPVAPRTACRRPRRRRASRGRRW